MSSDLTDNFPRPFNVTHPTLPDIPSANSTLVKAGRLTEDEATFIMDTTLLPKHRKDASVLLFIDSFLRCKSVRQASDEAGIHISIGQSYRHRKDINNTIQKIIDKSAMKYGFDCSEIFERVKEVVEFDPIMLQNADGTFKSNLHDIEPAARRNLKSLKVKNLWNQVEDINGIKRKIIIGEVIEYEFYDKLKAAELTGREKEMFKNTTRVEHGLTKDMADILLESAKRAETRRVTEVTPITCEYKEVKDDDN